MREYILFNNQSNKNKKSISKRQSTTMDFPKQSVCLRNEMTNNDQN